MPPEQLQRSLLDVDARADVYALGAVLYELACLRPMLDGDTEERLTTQILFEEPPAPQKLTPDLPADLATIITKATRKDPRERYLRAADLAEDLDCFLEGKPISARPPSTGYLLQLFLRRHRIAVGVALASACLLVLLVAGWMVSLQSAWREEKAARELAQRREQAARRSLYALNLNSVDQALAAGDPARAGDLLLAQVPKEGEEDLRGFEWYYSWRRSHPDDESSGLSLIGHLDLVMALDFSPDGTTLASASRDHTVKLWDTRTWRESKTLSGHDAAVLAVAFSPRGDHLATGSSDGTAILWNLATGERRSLAGNGGAVRAVAFSPDGARLATAGEHGGVKLWPVAGGEAETLAVSGEGLRALAFSPDGAKLAAAGDEQLIRVMDLKSGGDQAFPGHLREVNCLAFSPDGAHLASGSWDGTVKLWAFPEGKEEASLARSGTASVAFSPDGKTLAGSSSDGAIWLWDFPELRQRLGVFGAGAARSVAFSPGGEVMASGEGTGVTLRDPRKPEEWSQWKGSKGDVSSLEFSPDGRTLASVVFDGPLKLRDVRTGEERRFPPMDNALCAAFSPDGKTLAVALVASSADGKSLNMRLGGAGTVKLWNLETAQEGRTFTDFGAGVHSLAFSPDGKTLVTSTSWADSNPAVTLWDLETGQRRLLLRHVEWVMDMTFSPDGTMLATTDGKARVWDPLSGECRLQLKGTWGVRMGCLAFSPGGEAIASGGDDRELRVWQAASGKELQALRGHGSKVRDVAYFPDGRVLASASQDGTVRLWDAVSGDERAILRGSGFQLLSLGISPDGRTLAVGDMEGSVLLWRAATEEDLLARQAPRRPRNLEPSQGSTISTWPLLLQAGPFEHAHPRVTHRSSRWQVRAEGQDYSTPAVNQTTPKDLTAFLVDREVLLPGTNYIWRVSYFGSNGQSSEFGEETRFTTPRFPFEPVPFDLSAHFNRDVVAEEGDPENDGLDAIDCLLVEEGFDGTSSGRPEAQGLPHSRVIGIHRLGDYSRPNALGFTPDDRSPIRIKVPGGRYSSIRFLILGVHNGSTMPVTMEYQGGAAGSGLLLGEDWFHDDIPSRESDANREKLRPGVVAILNGMDRVCRGEIFENVDDPAIFEMTLKTDPTKTLEALVLEPGKASYQANNGRFFLFAATGVKAAP